MTDFQSIGDDLTPSDLTPGIISDDLRSHGQHSSARRRPEADPQVKKYTENFSDLWVRIDDRIRSRPPVTEPSDAELSVRVLFETPAAAAAAAAGVPNPSAALLSALLLIVMALSPPRT